MTTPSPNISSVCTSSSGDDSGAAQVCPERNFFKVACVGSDCSAPRQFKFEYLLNSTGTPHVTQWRAATASLLSIPDIRPLKLTITNAALTTLGEVTFTKSMFSSGSAGLLVPGTNAFVSVVESGATLGTATVSAQQMSCTGSGGSVTFSWSPVPGATSYSIYSGTSSGNTITLETSGLTSTSYTIPSVLASGTSYFVVKSTNGVSFTTSNEVAIQTVALGTPTISGAVGSVFSVTAISTFTGLTSCMVYGDVSNVGAFSTNLGVVSGAGGNTPGAFSGPGNYYARLVCTNATGGSCTYTSATAIAVP